jgi:hypothetical protein
MPDQVVYTSSESGIRPGKSGYCIVAATSGVDKFILSKIEKISEFSHEQSKKYLYDRIYSLQRIELAGLILHVLTRSIDAGFDFSGRTNYISHHLIFSEQEVCSIKNPCDVFRGWDGWLNNWQNGISKTVKFNSNDVNIIPESTLFPCKSWRAIIGDFAAALTPNYIIKETPMVVDRLKPDEVLALIHESLELKSILDLSNNCNSSLWDITFTTSGVSEESNRQFLWCFKYGKPGDENSLRNLYDRLKSRFCDNGRMISSYLTHPPKVIFNLENSKFEKGETIFIEAEIESGFPLPNIKWFKNTNNSHWSLLGSGDKFSLICEEEGEIQVYCKSINLRGEHESEVKTIYIVKKLDLEIGLDIDLNCDISHNNDISQPQSSKRNTYEPNYVETPSRPDLMDRFSNWLFHNRWGKLSLIVVSIVFLDWLFKNLFPQMYPGIFMWIKKGVGSLQK